MQAGTLPQDYGSLRGNMLKLAAGYSNKSAADMAVFEARVLDGIAKHGEEPARTQWHATKRREEEAFLLACFQGDVERAEALLNAGCDVRAVNELSETGLMLAANKGYAKLVPRLLAGYAKLAPCLLARALEARSVHRARLHGAPLRLQWWECSLRQGAA